MTSAWEGDRLGRSARYAASVVVGWSYETLESVRMVGWPEEEPLFAPYTRLFARLTAALDGEHDRRLLGVDTSPGWRPVVVALAELPDRDFAALRRWGGAGDWEKPVDCGVTLLRALGHLEHCRRLVEPTTLPQAMRAALANLGAGGDR